MSAERWVALAAAVILAAAVVIAARRSDARGDGVVTPLVVFLAVWAGALALFAIPYVRYTHTRAGVWATVYGSIAAFAIGCLTTQHGLRRVRVRPPAEYERLDSRRLRLVWLTCVVLGLIGFAGFVHAVAVVSGIGTLVTNPGLARDIQTTSTEFTSAYGPWKFLTYFNQVAFLLWTLALRERVLTHGRWRRWRVLGLVSLVPYVFTGDRGLMLATLLWGGFFHLIYRPLPSVRRLLAIGAAGLVALVAVFAVLGARVGKTTSAHPEIARTLTTRAVDPLALPYVYLTANVATFDEMTRDPLRPHTHGKMTILPAVKVVHGVGIGGAPPEVVGAYYPIPFETFNNYTWLGAFWQDFGPAGCVLLAALVGALTSWAAVLALRRRTLLSLYVASLLLYAIAFTPLLNKVTDTLTWEYLIAGPFVVAAIRAQPSPRALVRAAHERLRRRPALGFGALGVAGLLVVVAGAGAMESRRGAESSRPSSVAAVTQTLRDAAALARRTRRNRGRYPGSQALASRLHAHDPARRFEPLASLLRLPPQDGTIGVWTSGRRLVLRGRAASGQLVGLDSALPSTTIAVGPELVHDGRFHVGLAYWASIDGRGSSTAPAHRAPRAPSEGLLFRGFGVPSAATMVDQLLVRSAPASACFRMTMQAKTDQLTRGVRAYLRLLYANQTSAIALVRPTGTPGPAQGIPPGTSGRYVEFTTTLRAARPVDAIGVFAIDFPGGEPVSGRLWVRDVSARRLSPSACSAADKPTLTIGAGHSMPSKLPGAAPAPDGRVGGP